MWKNPPGLSIATEKVCFISIKARQFDVKDVVTDPDDASNLPVELPDPNSTGGQRHEQR